MNLKIKSVLASALAVAVLFGVGVVMAKRGTDLRMNDSDKADEDTARVAMTLPQDMPSLKDIVYLKKTVEILTDERTSEWKVVISREYTEFEVSKNGKKITAGGKDDEIKISDLNAEQGDRSYFEEEDQNTTLNNLPTEKGARKFRITVQIKTASGETTSKTKKLTSTNNGEGNWHD